VSKREVTSDSQLISSLCPYVIPVPESYTCLWCHTVLESTYSRSPIVMRMSDKINVPW